MSYDLLDGVKVVELAMYAFAPSSAAVLADWGADVIKVVPPDVADPMMGTPIAGLPNKDVGVAFMWEIMNRGKRCIALDVSTDDGRDVLSTWCAAADVFITNLLPGARRRFRVDPDDLFDVIPAWSTAGPPGHGDRGRTARARRLRPHRLLGPDRNRARRQHGVRRVRTAGRTRPGRPVRGDVPRRRHRRRPPPQGRGPARGPSSTCLCSPPGCGWPRPGWSPVSCTSVANIPRFRHRDLPNPLVAGYATRDGRLIYLAGIQTEGHFETFCELIDRKDLLEDPRFADSAARQAHTRECIAVLDEIFAERDLDEWVVVLRDLSTPWTIVQSAAEAAVDPQVTANQYVARVEGLHGPYPSVASPAQFDDQPPSLTRAPDHGEHTQEILLELGRSWEDIAVLQERDAIP